MSVQTKSDFFKTYENFPDEAFAGVSRDVRETFFSGRLTYDVSAALDRYTRREGSTRMLVCCVYVLLFMPEKIPQFKRSLLYVSDILANEYAVGIASGNEMARTLSAALKPREYIFRDYIYPQVKASVEAHARTRSLIRGQFPPQNNPYDAELWLDLQQREAQDIMDYLLDGLSDHDKQVCRDIFEGPCMELG